MTTNKLAYWAIIMLFASVYTLMFFAGPIRERLHSYQCETDMECYEECVQVSGIINTCE